MRSVFAYPTLFGDIDLEVTSASVDGDPLPYARISKKQRTVALHDAGRANWDHAALRVKAALPASELRDGPWTDIQCLAVLSEKVTNSRDSTLLSLGGDGHWHGTIDLARARYQGRAALTLIAVGTVNDVVGRLIGSVTQAWIVDLASSKPVRQRDIEISEQDFRDGPLEWLRPFKEAPWIVDTSADIPTVYLNTNAVEGFTEILGATGRSDEERMVRDLVATQIAQDAWTAMFQSAINGLDSDDDGTPLMPSDWRASVLKMMLPDVLPGRELTEALHEVSLRRADGYGWAGIQTGIQFAAGRRSQVSRKLTNAIRTVHQKGQS